MRYCVYLPLKNQVMFGAGEPSAVQDIVASFPSSAVKLEGGWIRMGIEAEKYKEIMRNCTFFAPQLNLSINGIRMCYMSVTNKVFLHWVKCNKINFVTDLI